MKALMVVGLVAAAIGAASASARPGAQSPAAHDRAALITTVNVGASEFKFVLSKKTAGRGVVIFKVKNVGKVSHDFKIKSRKTRMIAPGKSATLRVTFVRKGHYPYTCTVPGHAAAGMKGVFTIT
jgi:uncharacterized cupredoxin-like copper-binding protein